MKKISLADVVINLSEAGRLIGKSQPWVNKLVKDGFIKRTARGLYSPAAVAQGYAASLIEQRKKASRTGTLSLVQAARAREIDLPIARAESKLITTEEMLETVDEIIGMLKADCDGVPASVTRDQILRRLIESALDAIFTRAADRLEQKAHDLSAGGSTAAAGGEDAPGRVGRKNRFYPASAGIPGRRSVAATPYIRDWVRIAAAGGGRYRRAVLVTFAQAGKTEGMLDILGARFDQRPVLTVYCAPSREFAVDMFEPRLSSMLDQVPSLSAKFARGRLNKKLRKVIGGTALRLIYAGSEVPLKGESAGLALVDELDTYAANIDRAGDPLGLIEARGDTFADFMCGVASTPSLGSVETEIDSDTGLIFWKPAPYDDVQSPIWRLWQEGASSPLVLAMPTLRRVVRSEV